MDAETFVKTIYIGDRALKSILLDGWDDRVVLHIDIVSRIRAASGQWDFYTDEDITDGRIVFTGVETITFDPPGFMPNDFIDIVEFQPLPPSDGQERFSIKFSAPANMTYGNPPTIIGCTIEIVARGIYLEDPKRPQTPITE